MNRNGCSLFLFFVIFGMFYLAAFSDWLLGLIYPSYISSIIMLATFKTIDSIILGLLSTLAISNYQKGNVRFSGLVALWGGGIFNTLSLVYVIFGDAQVSINPRIYLLAWIFPSVLWAILLFVSGIAMLKRSAKLEK